MHLMLVQDVELWYVAWDILLINGAAVNEQPLLERKKLLRQAVRDAPPEGGWVRLLALVGCFVPIAGVLSHKVALACACAMMQGTIWVAGCMGASSCCCLAATRRHARVLAGCRLPRCAPHQRM